MATPTAPPTSRWALKMVDATLVRSVPTADELRGQDDAECLGADRRARLKRAEVQISFDQPV
jgi:hypothetical protein